MPTESTKPLVSIVLPFYNELRFLADAVTTVREQSVAAWELLLVDDGSTDGSTELAERLAASDPTRIRVFHHPGRHNRGLPASRNLGLRQASAVTIAFLDADDRWMPDKLAAQLADLDRLPDVAMTCGPTWYRHDDDERGTLTPVVDRAPCRFERGEFARRLLHGTLVPPPPSNVLFRTSALRAVGGVPDGDNLYEDQRTFFAVNLEHPVYVTSSPLSTYAVRPDSLYGSLADLPEVRRDQRRQFERWARGWGLRRGVLGARVIAGAEIRRVRRAVTRRVRSAVQRSVPDPLETRLRTARRAARRMRIRFGSLRRLTPIDANWGYGRGQPIDRHYIDRFIERNGDQIRGHVLEVAEPGYTERFGAGVARSDVVDIDRSNPQATIIADLRDPHALPEHTFDCIIMTETLQFVDDLDASVGMLWRALRPGGSLLVSVPTVSKLEPSLADVERWRITPHGLARVLERACPGGELDVEGFGNLLVSTAFLYGLATEDLRPRELEHYDPIFPTGVCARATKSSAGDGPSGAD